MPRLSTISGSIGDDERKRHWLSTARRSFPRYAGQDDTAASSVVILKIAFSDRRVRASPEMAPPEGFV
jgi:hypothetical protein